MHRSRQDHTDFLGSCFFMIRKRITSFDIVVTVFLTITIVSCLVNPDVVFQFNYDDNSAQNMMIFLFSVFLFIAHRIHLELFRIPSRLPTNRKHTSGNAKDYREFIKEYRSEKDTLAFVIVTLPLGLSLVSEVFGTHGVLKDFGELAIGDHHLRVLAAIFAYHFLKSVFFVMLTLQMASLYDKLRKRWKNYVITSMALNLIGFSLMLLIMAPDSKKDFYYEPYTIIAMILASFASLYVSFNVIAYSRIFRKPALDYSSAAKFAAKFGR